jgi:hypothetical protein
MAGLMRKVGSRKGPLRTGKRSAYGCLSDSRSQSAERYDLPFGLWMHAAFTGLDVSRIVTVVLTKEGTSEMGCPFCTLT